MPRDQQLVLGEIAEDLQVNAARLNANLTEAKQRNRALTSNNKALAESNKAQAELIDELFEHLRSVDPDGVRKYGSNPILRAKVFGLST